VVEVYNLLEEPDTSIYRAEDSVFTLSVNFCQTTEGNRYQKTSFFIVTATTASNLK
jgi:hypothetical protein